MTTRLAAWRAAAAARPRALALVVGLACAIALVLALTIGGHEDPAAAAPGDEARTSGATDPAAALTPAERTAAAVATLPTSSARQQLHVPALGLEAPVVPVPLRDGGVLDPPADVADVGWWDGSAEPGGEVGQTVMTGHSVHDGGGVMDDLEQLRAGDVVRVTDPDGHVDYEVVEVTTWSKAQLAARAVETFGQDRHHGRLVLVTCEDWDGDDYASNVVVFAEPLTLT